MNDEPPSHIVKGLGELKQTTSGRNNWVALDYIWRIEDWFCTWVVQFSWKNWYNHRIWTSISSDMYNLYNQIYLYIYIILYVYIRYINKYSHIKLHPQAGFGCSSEGSQNFKPAALLTPRVWDPCGLMAAEVVQKKASPWVSKILKRCFKHVQILIRQRHVCIKLECQICQSCQKRITAMGVDEATIKPWTVKNPSFPARVQ